jgi:hypothetical protein
VRAAPATFTAILGLSLLAAVVVPRSAAQISAEEQRKRDLFLKARESIQPAPAATPSKPPVRPQPRPRPVSDGIEQPLEPAKPITLPPPRATPRATPRPKPTPEPRATPKPKATPAPREAPPVVAEEPDDIVLSPPKDETDDVIQLPPPRRDPTPPPRPPEREEKEKRVEEVPAAPIVVEKSGVGEDEGLAPVPEKEKRGWFGLGGGPRYRYLTRAVRSAIDRAPVKRGRWQYIIVHNSGTRQGNARIFANYHKNVRKMKNGLAYHFVIGNGTSSGDGEIEIGPRWTRQINGGHVASDYLNNIAIGICFVGDFNRDVPTKAQLAALEEIIKYLRKRVGRSKGKVLIVKAHREINPKPTDCPGNRFPYRWLHRTF